ncbi:MAG: glycosyltransferase family A protein [Dongiaceae bacterium]
MSAPAATGQFEYRLLAEEPMSEEDWCRTLNLLERSADEIASPVLPEGLFGRPCPLPAAAWHLQELGKLSGGLGASGVTPASEARSRYHRRMLAYLIDPQRHSLRPLVTIVIPVCNRADLLVEAVRSCLEQSWHPIEIIVVDDGSDDDPAAALQEFGNKVQLHRKPNGGVASARNAGIQLARGDFIHFLDSDDLLLPDAVARKVASFAAIPDAALCFSMATEQNLPGVRVPTIRAPDGTERCVTSDLLHAVLNRCPFYVPTVMMPRWAMLALPPFEEDLRRGEDSRYWLTLGLARAKAIGLTEPLTIRRVVADGLSTTPHVGEPPVDIKLRNLRDVLCTPSAWHHARFALISFAQKLGQMTELSEESLERIPAYGQLVATLTGLGDGQPRDGLSPVPLLVDIANALEASSQYVASHWPQLWRDLSSAVFAAIISAAPMTNRDLVYWGHHTLRVHTRTSIAGLFKSLLKAAEKEPEVARRFDPVLRRTFPTPSSHTVKRYRKLRRKLRSGLLAAWLTWPSAYLRPFR